MLHPTEWAPWQLDLLRPIERSDLRAAPFRHRIDFERILSRWGGPRERRRRRSLERRDRRLMQGYINKAKKFLPIVRGDLFVDEVYSAVDRTSRRPGCRSPYQISELTLDLRTTESELRIREQGSTDSHEWIITDENCIRRSKRQNDQVYREKRIVGLPRSHRFQVGLLTKFYMDNSVLEFDSVVVKLKADGVVPEALHTQEITIRKLTLELPSHWHSLPSHVSHFLAKISQPQLVEVHLECNHETLQELLVLPLFRDVDIHATIFCYFAYSMDGSVPKTLKLRCLADLVTKNQFHEIVDQYCEHSKVGKLFATEIRENEVLDIFVVINEFLEIGGWSFATFDNHIAASKDLGTGSEVLVYYNSVSKQWTVENGPVRSQEYMLAFPLLEQVDVISRMTYKERMKLRETMFWEPLVHYHYKSISVNFDDPEVKLNGCTLPNVASEYDAKVELKALLKNPKSTVKKFKVVGDYLLFRTMPMIQASEVWIQGDNVFNSRFFDPFKNVHLNKLVVSTRKIVDHAKHMIDSSDRFVVLDEMDDQEIEDSDEETDEVSDSKINGFMADSKKQDDGNLQIEIVVDSEPELEDSDINYEAIELDFEKPEFKLNGETLPAIESSYDVYKKMSNLASEQMTIRELKITGQYPLFQNVQKFRTLELWLDNYGVYPASFFEPLKGNRLKKLTVSSEIIVKEAKELVSRAKKFVVLEDSEDDQKNEEAETYDDDGEPQAKRAKLDDSVLNESTPEPSNSDDDGEPQRRRSKRIRERSLSKASAPSRSVSPAMSPPIRFPTPEPDRRVQTPILDYGFGNDFQMEWALSESAGMQKAKKPSEPPKEPPVHYLSKKFVPQPLFPIPINGYQSTSNGGLIDSYDPLNHYNLSRYEEAGPFNTKKPQYIPRSLTPTEPYVPIAPFDMKKYEDEFHMLQIHEDGPVRKATPIDSSDDTDDDDNQPGPSGF